MNNTVRNQKTCPSDSLSRDSHSGIPFMTNSSVSTEILNPDDPQVKMWRACWE